MRFRRDVTPSHSNRASGEMAVRGRPMRRCRRADAISVKSSPEVIEPVEKQVSFISGLETEMETLRDSTAEINSSAPSRNDMAKESVYFLGLDFDGGSIEEAASNILAEAHERFRYIVTPNVHHMVRMLEDPVTLRPLYERAWRVFCDSRVLSRLARVGGLSLPVITGSDLTADLIARAAKHGLTIAVIGPTDAACARLQDKYPGLRIRFAQSKDGIYTIGTRDPQMCGFCRQGGGSPGFPRGRKAAARNSCKPNCGSSASPRRRIMYRRGDRFSYRSTASRAGLGSESGSGMVLSSCIRSTAVCSTLSA